MKFLRVVRSQVLSLPHHIRYFTHSNTGPTEAVPNMFVDLVIPNTISHDLKSLLKTLEVIHDQLERLRAKTSIAAASVSMHQICASVEHFVLSLDLETVRHENINQITYNRISHKQNHHIRLLQKYFTHSNTGTMDKQVRHVRGKTKVVASASRHFDSLRLRVYVIAFGFCSVFEASSDHDNTVCVVRFYRENFFGSWEEGDERGNTRRRFSHLD